jgi:NADH-quinone oxidoreductase subunit A
MAYIPVLILMLMAAAVGGLVIVASTLIGPRNPNKKKDTAFECGVPTVGDARHRISVRFYLVAILFLLFDVEAIFFFPWAVVFKKFLAINSFILLEMSFFVGILLVGYFYVLRKGALDWE